MMRDAPSKSSIWWGRFTTEANVYDELDKTLARARRNTLGDLLARTRDRMPDKEDLVQMGF